jgi:hypothetical protein
MVNIFADLSFVMSATPTPKETLGLIDHRRAAQQTMMLKDINWREAAPGILKAVSGNVTCVETVERTLSSSSTVCDIVLGAFRDSSTEMANVLRSVWQIWTQRNGGKIITR